MGRRAKPARVAVYPPTETCRYWHVVYRAPGGERNDRYCPTEAEARKLERALAAEIAQPVATVDEAIKKYEGHLTAKGGKASSWKHTEWALRRFFADEELGLEMLTPRLCARYYAALTERYAAASHHNALAQAKTFLRWCQDRGWVNRSPLDRLSPVGTPSTGKPQLRVTEARLFMDACLAEGSDGAVACLMCFLLSMRESEIVTRVVRDVDDEGKLLWIAKGKTKAARRQIEVPEVLATLLVERTRDRPAESWLFPAVRGESGRHWRDWVTEECVRLCEVAKVPRVTSHGLRGTHASLARAAGASGHVVAATLGHERVSMQERAYAKPEAVQAAQTRQVMKLLQGGKR